MQIRINNTRISLSLIIAILFSAFKTMPVFIGYTNGYIEIGIVIFLFLSLFPLQNGVLKRFFYICAFFVPFLLLEMFIVHNRSYVSIIHAISVLFEMLIIILYAACLIEKHSYDEMRIVMVSVALMLTITQITTIINIDLFPHITRRSIMGVMSSEYQHDVSKHNIGGFEYAYLAPAFTISMYALFKKKKLNLLVFVLHILLTLYFLIKVEFTIAIILYVIEIAALIISNGNKKKMIIVILLSPIVLLLLRNVLIEVLSLLSMKSSTYVFRNRFSELSAFLNGEVSSDSDISSRIYRYSISLFSFIRHPLLGSVVWSKEIGEHSMILDFIASFGTIGILLLYQALKVLYFGVIKGKCEDGELSFLIFYMFCSYIAFSFLNISIGSTQLFLLIVFSVDLSFLNENRVQVSNHNESPFQNS